MAGHPSQKKGPCWQASRSPREGWWRRRESNPRPKILPSSFYMLSSSLRYRPAEFPGTSFLHRYPAKVSLLFWQAHHRNYPAESTPFADSAGENQQDG